jgi:DNA-binding NtrC family response regulator
MPPETPVADERILVVDDESLIRQTLAEYLTQEGFGVCACASGQEALRTASDKRYDVALCDVQLPDMDGIELLKGLLKLNPETLPIVITAYATVESAVEAFHQGAQDYLMKPILLDDLLIKVRRLLAYRDLSQENQNLRRQLHSSYDPQHIIGRSAAMKRVFEMVRKVGPTRSTVLLVGESGTGKELIARALHAAGGGNDARFLAINCAAIPHDLLENQLFGHKKGAFTGADRDEPGIFAHAGAGTVFLDEISEIPITTQAKLLRAIDEKEIFPVGAREPVAVTARVLAATNKDLSCELAAGRFREDLYYRLNVVTIALPPLRERREDIPDLVEFLLAKHAASLGKRMIGVSHETMQILRACPWRGNIRELENALERAAILGEGSLITPADLPPDLAPVPDDPELVEELGEAVRRFERRHIERILAQAPDKKEAARRLGMGLSSLYRRIADLGVQAP